ncbi:MAG: PKD domain-containing protein [Holophagales bacterium]|nr:PKD domain-containing protein [Holophagales bacterium]
MIQATVLHEVGHTLGLHHIFQLPGTNADSFSVMNYANDDAARWVTRIDSKTVRTEYPSRSSALLDIAIYPLVYGNKQYAQEYATISKSSVSPGESFTADRWTIQNVGNQAASNVVVTFYAWPKSSGRQYPQPGDVVLVNGTVGSFPVDGDGVYSAPLSVPSGTAAGEYYVGAIVTVNGSEDQTWVAGKPSNNRFIFGHDPRTVLRVLSSGGGGTPVTADFSWTPVSPLAGQPVGFVDASRGSPTTYSWNFGDAASGGANTSTAKNPSHTYANPGSYTVTLAVSGSGSSNQTQRTLAVAGKPTGGGTATQTLFVPIVLDVAGRRLPLRLRAGAGEPRHDDRHGPNDLHRGQLPRRRGRVRVGHGDALARPPVRRLRRHRLPARKGPRDPRGRDEPGRNAPGPVRGTLLRGRRLRRRENDDTLRKWPRGPLVPRPDAVAAPERRVGHRRPPPGRRRPEQPRPRERRDVGDDPPEGLHREGRRVGGKFIDPGHRARARAVDADRPDPRARGLRRRLDPHRADVGDRAVHGVRRLQRQHHAGWLVRPGGSDRDRRRLRDRPRPRRDLHVPERARRLEPLGGAGLRLPRVRRVARRSRRFDRPLLRRAAPLRAGDLPRHPPGAPRRRRDDRPAGPATPAPSRSPTRATPPSSSAFRGPDRRARARSAGSTASSTRASRAASRPSTHGSSASSRAPRRDRTSPSSTPASSTSRFAFASRSGTAPRARRSPRRRSDLSRQASGSRRTPSSAASRTATST